MRDKPTTERIVVQMLYELANDDGYIAFRWAAEDRDEWRKNLLFSRILLTQMTNLLPHTAAERLL